MARSITADFRNDNNRAAAERGVNSATIVTNLSFGPSFSSSRMPRTASSETRAGENCSKSIPTPGMKKIRSSGTIPSRRAAFSSS